MLPAIQTDAQIALASHAAKRISDENAVLESAAAHSFQLD